MSTAVFTMCLPHIAYAIKLLFRTKAITLLRAIPTFKWESGVVFVGYMEGTTGGTLRDTEAESFGYIGEAPGASGRLEEA